MNPDRFDYAIVGNGLAGFQLALALVNDSHFQSNKKIG